MESKFKHTAEEIRREIENITTKSGLLCRVFSRGKDEHSLNSKLSRSPNKYSIDGKLIQDAIGIRVALYFEEDISIVEKLLTDRFSINRDASTVDSHSTDQFTVSRHNLVFAIPERSISDMKRGIGDRPIDTTFEVQLRSILSEGWHEVDHDLRYKSKSSWDHQDDLSRALNGILATIQTSEWTMRKIFDDLAYRHYKNKNWSAMLHNKVRMRTPPELSAPILEYLDKNPAYAKEVLRINRKEVIYTISKSTPAIPLKLDNILFTWNNISTKDEFILSITPKPILESINKK